MTTAAAARSAALVAVAAGVAACQFSLRPVTDASATIDDLGVGDLAPAGDFSRAVPDGAVARGLGYPCNGASECDSASCVDGYCCETLCDPSDKANLCKACNVPGHEGRCFDALTGTDPHQQCEPEPMKACALDGLCDGHGACRRVASGTDGGCEERALGQACTLPSDCASGFCAPGGVCCDGACTSSCQSCTLAGQAAGHCANLPMGTACAAAACMGDKTVSARSCDNSGVCAPGIVTDCTPYTCNTANATCFARPCSNGTQCANGHTCNGGSQKCQ